MPRKMSKKKRKTKRKSQYVVFQLLLLIAIIMAVFIYYRKPSYPDYVYYPYSLQTGESQLVEPMTPPLRPTLKFTVTDANSGGPVVNAKITVYYDDPILGHAEWVTYTDSSGYGELHILGYQWTYAKIEHQNYETYEFGPFDTRTSGELSFDITLTPRVSPPPPSSYTLTIYAQADEKRWFVTGSVTINSQKYLLTQDYPHRVIIYGLASGTYNLVIEGRYTQPVASPFGDHYEFVYFEYHVSVNVPSDVSDVEYWIDVMTGVIQEGEPPYIPPEPDPWQFLLDFINWLAQNWMLVLIVAIIIFVLPYIVYILGWFERLRPPRPPAPPRLCL